MKVAREIYPPFWVVRLFAPRTWVIVIAVIVLGLSALAWGASTTIPERAQALCQMNDCSASVQHIRGSRRRLTISVDDDAVSFGTLTHRLFSDAGFGQVCANCSLPTELQAVDTAFMIQALMWQTPASTWQGELRAACLPGQVPVIYKVYPLSAHVVDNADVPGVPSIFQIDVRVGCIGQGM